MLELRKRLAAFKISLERGFLPENDPIQRLDVALKEKMKGHRDAKTSSLLEAFEAMETVAANLPELIGAGGSTFRPPIRSLPEVDPSILTTHRELRRALLVLSCLAHAYVWGDADEMQRTLPENISRPLWAVSQRLDVPPVLTHASIVLFNWRRLDPYGPITTSNISTLNAFLGGWDESWFFLLTVEMEVATAPAISSALLCQDAVAPYS